MLLLVAGLITTGDTQPLQTIDKRLQFVVGAASGGGFDNDRLYSAVAHN